MGGSPSAGAGAASSAGPGSRAAASRSIPAMARQVEAHMRSFFPGLEGKRVEHAWGGPIDVSPTHLPIVRSLAGGAFAGFGYTGNGVGPSQMIGRSLAALAAGVDDRHASMALVDPPASHVPPEPFRFIGGNVIRRAILRKESLEEQGRVPGPLTRAVSGIPGKIGIHVPLPGAGAGPGTLDEDVVEAIKGFSSLWWLWLAVGIVWIDRRPRDPAVRRRLDHDGRGASSASCSSAPGSRTSCSARSSSAGVGCSRSSACCSWSREWSRSSARRTPSRRSPTSSASCSCSSASSG